MAGVRNDGFGNATILRMAHQVKNRKTGELMPIYKTYLEVGGHMVKVEISHASQEDKKTGGEGMWVKFTKVNKNRNQGGGFGSGGGSYGQQRGF
jgi:hypothetical protein